ncbi:MAG: 2-phosphosulfolactate phosphatase [Bacteroidales bacterium]|nr:2-phosphosulfolactate phosphatase [Bacteroidales bacterium]
MPTIEAILTPVLFEARETRHAFVTVVVDVLRATSAFNAAFDSGIESIVPVADLEQLRYYTTKNFLTAAERDGNKVDFTDFGNSPTRFLNASLEGRHLAYSTTNGTRALGIAAPHGPLITAAFTNLDKAVSYLNALNLNVVILCSGWKDSISLEDTLCAGAIIQNLSLFPQFHPTGDAAEMSQDMWLKYNTDIVACCSRGDHYQRLLNLGLTEDLKHCLSLNISESLPVFDGRQLINFNSSVEIP